MLPCHILIAFSIPGEMNQTVGTAHPPFAVTGLEHGTISILAKFSEIYAPHIDKANSILSFRVDDENETTEEQQCNSRQ